MSGDGKRIADLLKAAGESVVIAAGGRSARGRARGLVRSAGKRIEQKLTGEKPMVMKRRKRAATAKRVAEDVMIEARETALELLIATEACAFDEEAKIPDIGEQLEQLGTLAEEWAELDE